MCRVSFGLLLELRGRLMGFRGGWGLGRAL